MCIDIDVNMDSCLRATSFCCEYLYKSGQSQSSGFLSLTLESQRFSRILEETLDIICSHLERAHTLQVTALEFSSVRKLRTF